MTEEQATAPAEQTPIEPAPEAPQDPIVEDAPSRLETLEKAFQKTGEAEQSAPVDPPKSSDEGQPRGPDGKFTAKEPAEEAQAAPEKPAEGKPDEKLADTPEASSDAPQRFSEDAKKAWAEAPESVRAETRRAIREMEAGIAEKDEVIGAINPFLKMAGDPQKLASAMGRYVNMENMLRQNPAQGFAAIAQNMGWSPEQVVKLMSGEQPGQPDPRDQHILALSQQVQQLMQAQGKTQQTVEGQQRASVEQQIAAFAAENPRFEELSGEIAKMLKLGYAEDLADAYQKAERLKPAPEPTQAPPAQPAQPRPALSVTGAPSAGSNPAARKPSTNRREALERAFHQTGL